MCRFLCYRGPDLLLADLLYRPENSLIRQSYQAKERKEPLNGDGFGVGWYSPALTPVPCVFRSVAPAWSNENLRRLSEHVQSPTFFAHVRAASPGMPVSEGNCHPFQYGPFLWMHNGTIEGFSRIKRRLQHALPDRFYHAIQGSTDSEHAFAVFLSLLEDPERAATPRDMSRALGETIARLEGLRAEAGVSAPAYHNFAVTDGRSVAAVRYVSDPTLEPISLYYTVGSKYECVDGIGRVLAGPSNERAVIIASERLTERKSDWVRVPPNHVLTVTPAFDVTFELMESRRENRGSKVTLGPAGSAKRDVDDGGRLAPGVRR